MGGDMRGNREGRRPVPPVCRLFAAGTGKWIGTAFAIGPRAFLTAKHVVDGYSPQQVVLGAPLFDPPQRLLNLA